jgi:hypothetical protein
MHRFQPKTRLRMEHLETRQLMARDLAIALDSEPTGGDDGSLSTVAVAPALAGDFNGDGVVSGRDFLQWQRAYGSANPMADADGSGVVDGADLGVWQQNFAPNVGGIQANVLNGLLFLEEAIGQEGLANGITISRLANGNLLVSGHDPTGEGVATLINGATSVEFAMVDNLYVYLGDGNNTLVFDDSMSAAQLQSVHIAGGAGAERVIIEGLKTSGDLSIGLSGGDDVIEIGPVPHYGLVAIGDGNYWDALYINTGGGADKVSILGGARIYGIVDVRTFDDVAEMDFDEVTFDYNIYAMRDVTVATGSGDDLVQFTNMQQAFQVTSGLYTLGTLSVDVGAGNDTVYLRGVKSDVNTDIFAGAGADNVTVDFQLLPDVFSGQDFLPRVGGNLTIQAYATLADTDIDQVRIINKATVSGSIIAKFAAGNDYFLLDKAEIVGNDVDVNMGDGDDTADISGYVVDHLMAWMGAGNDTLNLAKTWAYRLIADGDAGSDSLSTTTQTKAQFIDTFEWEFINGWAVFDDLLWGEDGAYWQE